MGLFEHQFNCFSSNELACSKLSSIDCFIGCCVSFRRNFFHVRDWIWSVYFCESKTRKCFVFSSLALNKNKGDFFAVGLGGDGPDGSTVLTPSQTVLWVLGTSDVLVPELPFFSKVDIGSSPTKCFTDLDRSNLWVVYMREGNAFSVGKFDFGEGLPEGKWTYWHPSAQDQYAPCPSAMQCVSPGLTIAGSRVLVPWTFRCVTTVGGAGLFSLDTVARDQQLAQWEPVILFNESPQTPFSSYIPQFAGIRSLQDKEVWIFGSFVVADAVLNGTVYVNLLRYDLVTNLLLPIETMDLPSVVPSSLYAGDFGELKEGELMFWAGGAMYSLPNGMDVLNLAGMSVESGRWKDSTQDYDAPPAGAEVAQIVFNRAKDTMTVVSRERTSPSLCNSRRRSGMNVFRANSVFPDPVQSEWAFDVSFVVPLNVAVSTELWLPVLFILSSAGLIIGLSALILFIWRLGARKSFRYIEIPNYQAHGVQTNVKAILQDQDVFKLPPGDVELKGLIGQGGQGVVRRATYKV